jgi:hypothetical protein
MDWALAITRNREALERILAALFALVGLDNRQSAMGSRQSGSAQAGDAAVSDCLLPTADCPASLADCRLFLPRHLHAYVQRILRAAESAIRRLVVIAARDIVVPARPGGEARHLSSPPRRGGEVPSECEAEWGQSRRIPAFPLFDPLRNLSFDPPRRPSKFFPRIWIAGYSEPAPIPEKPVLSPDDPLDATGLHRRLLSSRRALANLPREARRLARWYQRNKLQLSQGRRPGRVFPLRLGRPPGLSAEAWRAKVEGRRRPFHAVDDILKECHAVAIDALSLADTS